MTRSILLVATTLLLSGCSGSAWTRVDGLTIDEAWTVVGEVLRRRGEITLALPQEHKMQIRHSRHYPHDLLVEQQVGPRYAESFGRVADVVEVRLRAPGGALAVKVAAWTNYRAFARQFDTEDNDPLADEVREHVLADLQHRAARLASARTLEAAQAERVPPEGMVFVPAGPFTMGSDDGHADEGPQLTATLGPYYIDATEVTVGQYREFITSGGYRTRRYWSAEGWRWKLMYGITAPKEWKSNYRATLPVIGVSYYEAEAYATWAGKQLPTEAQWEKAARYDVPSRYPWGNTWIAVVNCLTDPRYGPCPVDHFPGNRSLVGCLQMAGNAAEWCRDWYAGSPSARGPETGTQRVLRGGSFFSRPDEVRCTYRDRAEPGERTVAYGFRCVREVRE